PNPFNTNTIINYTIPENEGQGRMVITDMKGSVIKTFNLNGKGRGQLQISRGSIASGEYVYSLWLGERVVTSKRMTVVN
ncbi:MAG: T9SS type A sorting domain-containing protein, partial [Chitinophagaceae bacterium]